MTANIENVVATIVWRGRKYRYTLLPKNYKLEDVPSWAKYGWYQYLGEGMDIGQPDKHYGIANSEIGWKLRHIDRFCNGTDIIIFSDPISC